MLQMQCMGIQEEGGLGRYCKLPEHVWVLWWRATSLGKMGFYWGTYVVAKYVCDYRWQYHVENTGFHHDLVGLVK